MVKIYGHYALVGHDQVTFHRHLLSGFDLTSNDGENRWAAYSFVRKLYDCFGPIHRKRIQDAILRLPTPGVRASMPMVDSEAGSPRLESQEMLPPSQTTGSSKRPRATASSPPAAARSKGRGAGKATTGDERFATTDQQIDRQCLGARRAIPEDQQAVTGRVATRPTGKSIFPCCNLSRG